MARAQGARAQIALAFETTYGTPPASGFTKIPFASTSLGAEQPLLNSELLGFGRDPQALAAYTAMIPPQPALPVDKRLPEISAAAKIAVASNQTQALGFLDRAERAALLNTPELLDRWARLPQ